MWARVDSLAIFYQRDDERAYFDDTSYAIKALEAHSNIIASVNGSNPDFDFVLRNIPQVKPLWVIPPLFRTVDCFDAHRLIFSGVVYSVSMDSLITVQLQR